jgi:hypothetical protein
MTLLQGSIMNLYFFSFLLGSDAILLGAETLCGLYAVEIISKVGRICAEVKFLSVL